ncbi:hypothetical protein ACFP3U_36300 [Kitasatospora misakiensis]|uniref:Uncharacterized protein n=1 Tax=Kitasatospora misakiensis TaxID=67330 RepID=A0ABW0XCV5_9ACTN
MTSSSTVPHRALRTVRLAPADGPPPSAGAPGTRFEARIHSPAGVCHGLLTTLRPGRPAALRGWVDEHLALDLTIPGATRWRHHADVLHLGPSGAVRARERLDAVLRAHPGCAVATAEDADGALLVLARTGGRLTLRAPSPGPRSAVGSLIHAWLTAGGALTDLASVSVTVPAPARGYRRGA